MVNPFWHKVAFLGRWKISLTTTIAVVLAAIVVRFYYSFVTGFLVPDEIWYYNTYVLDRTPMDSYRPVFVAIFVLFFNGVTNVWTFLLRGAIYSAIWAVGCVALFFMIFRRLRVPENMSSLLILSLPLFPVFIVFVPTILTETLGLFMALLGVYFALRHVQEGRMVNSLLSGVFFVAAANVREPYLLFVLGYLLLFFVLSVKQRSPKSVIGYAIPFSVLLWQFARGDYAWAVRLMSQLASGPQLNPSSLTASSIDARLAFGVPLIFTLHPDLLRAVAVAFWYGFNPLFALFAVLSIIAVGYDLVRTRSVTALFLALNAMWSLGAFVGTADIRLETLIAALSVWTSVIIRATHSSLPLIVAFPRFYSRLKVRRAAGLILILLIVSSTQIGSSAGAFQVSLSREPIDRLSLDYRAPYYRLYLLAKDSGRTLVFGGIHMRGIIMYMAMLPNVVLVPVSGDTLNETEFKAWLERDWDTVLLYDDYWTIEMPSMLDAYPQFYSEILRTRQYHGYAIETLWIDGESYALRMFKVSDDGRTHMNCNDVGSSGRELMHVRESPDIFLPNPNGKTMSAYSQVRKCTLSRTF